MPISGVDLHEPVVEVALVVEDGPADVVLGPGDGGEVRVGPVAAGEHLVAGSQGVEEVDGVAPGDAVAGRADVDLDAVVGQDVGRLADVVPVVQPEGEVVQPAVGPGDHGQVVGRVGPLHPDADLVAVAVQQLLGEAEAQDLHVEAGRLADLLGGDQDVVDAGRGDADQALGRGRGGGDPWGQPPHPLDLPGQPHPQARG